MKDLRAEAAVYASHVIALFRPGRNVRTHDVVPPRASQVGSLTGWSPDDLQLLVEEGRRTLDYQQGQFDRIRTTAQVVLPLSIALLALVAAELTSLIDPLASCPSVLWYVGWSIGTILVLLSGLGAAAVLSVKSGFGTVFPPLLSQCAPPILPILARAIAEEVPTGERTLGTRLTVMRDAVWLLCLGGVIHLIVWISSEIVH